MFVCRAVAHCNCCFVPAYINILTYKAVMLSNSIKEIVPTGPERYFFRACYQYMEPTTCFNRF